MKLFCEIGIWICPSFGSSVKLKVGTSWLSSTGRPDVWNSSGCIPNQLFFLYNTWPPVFSSFLGSARVVLLGNSCLPSVECLKVSQINFWKCSILYRLYSSHYLVDTHLEEESEISLNHLKSLQMLLFWCKLVIQWKISMSCLAWVWIWVKIDIFWKSGVRSATTKLAAWSLFFKFAILGDQNMPFLL